MKKEKGTIKSPNHYDRIRTELTTIYVTSAGTRYLKKMDALSEESQIVSSQESKDRRYDKIMDICEILLNVLKENNWGVYYNIKPMQSLTVKDGASLYKINEVDEDVIETAICKALEENNWNKHTQHHTPKEETLQNKG